MARDTEKSQPAVKKQLEHTAPVPAKKTIPQKAPVKPEKPEKLSANSIEDSKIYAALRSYRYNQAQKENIKPYMICNNEQLVNLIQKNPRTLKELRTLPGFDSDEKCRKYGKEILQILAEHLPKPTAPAKSEKPANPSVTKQSKQSLVKPGESVEDSKVYVALRSYRYQQSQKENIKPYLIYNNEQLVNLIQKNPRTLKELRTLPGFDSDEKCKKYGTEILRILAEHLPKPTAPAKSEKPANSPVPKKSLVKPGESVEDSKIYGALRSYRYNQAQKENIKPYMICNNDQLVKLIQANPETIAELKKLDGFRDDQKFRKYGSAILKILKDFQ
ncbi:MAG: HRDC domain-containing protein [Oscillospiraceae bacterium]|nr:HRDC domain-containing protein [Oscillospiraceae bacterium]